MKPARQILITLLPLFLTLSAGAQTSAQLSPTISALLEPNAAGTDNLIINASGVTGTENWQVNWGSSDWLTVLPNQGNVFGFQNGGNLLRFQFAANTGPTRSATISMSGGANAVDLTVIQAGSSFVHAGLLTVASAASGLLGPMGLAADNQGNLFIADGPAHTVFEWVASSQQLNPYNTGYTGGDPTVLTPWGVALDAAGDKFFLFGHENTNLYEVDEQPVNSSDGSSTQVWSSTSITPQGLCVDAAGQNVDLDDGAHTGSCAIDLMGNVFASDPGDQAITKETPSNAFSFLYFPLPNGGPDAFTPTTGGGVTNGLSVDNGDFVYYLDLNGTRLMKYDASSTTQQVTRGQATQVAIALGPVFYSAVDSARNVYLSEGPLQRVRELPNAYISSMGPFVETAAAGTESIQVLPTTQNLTGIYAPVSNNPTWLTVTAGANGVVQISFAVNASQQRTGSVTLLGRQIQVTQWPSTASVSALVLTAGNNQSAAAGGAPFATNLQVTAYDPYGDTIPGVQVTFSSPSVTFGAPYNNSYTATTDINGIATAIPMSATVAGPITVTAIALHSGIYNITQYFQLSAVGGQIVAVAGSPQGVLLNQQFATNLKVIVYDQNGNPVSGASVIFSVPANGPSGTFSTGGASATVQTGPDGSATAPPLIANGTPGSFTASAYYSAATAQYVSFNLTNYTNIYPTSGLGQSAALNTVFSSNLAVLVVDQNTNPTPGVAVTFTVNAGGSGASGTFSGGVTTVVVPTGSNGIASAPPLTANGTVGAFTVVVSAPGLPSQTFNLSNSVSDFNYGANQSGVTTRTLPQPFIVQASSGATAGTMVFTVVPSADNGAGGSFKGAASITVNLDSQGYGTSPQLTTNNIPGGFTVTAYDGVTTAVTNITTVECLNPGNPDVPVSAANDSSLRNAVNNACAGSTIDLTQLTGTITLASRLRIDDSLTIVGPGAGALAIDGGMATRLFFIGGGTVSISDLTLQNGLGQGGGSSEGGAAAGMGGAIFMNGGTVSLSGVTFSGNQALGGSTGNNAIQWGGGGFGADGGLYTDGRGGPGGTGGDLFGLGGMSYGGPVAASGGPGGGGAGAVFTRNDNGGNGGFGGGGGNSEAASSGNGGFGGGGGGGFAELNTTPGNGGFGGGTGFVAGNDTSVNGGGGAGFGGAIFAYAGTLTLINDQFLNNSAVGGISNVQGATAAAVNNGQGKGGALFIYNGAVAINNASTFGVGTGNANIAADAGLPAIGNSTAPYTAGVTCPGQDSADVCGTLLQVPTVSLTGPSYGVYGSTFGVTAVSNSGATPSIVATAGPCQVNGTTVTMTGGAGTCQLQATWPATSAYAGGSASLSVPAAAIEVTPSVTVASKTFDGTTAAMVTGCSLSNVLAADAGNVTCTASNAAFVSAGADVNIPVTVTGIALAGPAAANYVLSSSAASTSANISFAAASSACIAAPAGITGWWKADSNANDATGVYNGTLGGNVSFAAGEVGQAFSFDGTQSPYVALPAGAFPAEPSASPFTFETWFQTSASTGGVILGSQSGAPYAGVPGGWTPAIYVGTDGALYAQMYWSTTGNGITSIVSPVPVNDGQWHHVAVTYDGSNEIVYLDGASIGTITSLTQANNGTPLYYQLGTGYTGSDWPAGNGAWFTFTGLIDEATVYSRALSAGEVASIVQAANYGKCNPVAALSPGALNFNSVAQGQSATLSEQISNSGNAPLTIASIATDLGDTNFTVLTGAVGDCAVGTPVAANRSCNVRVQFTPQTGGSLNGQINITDNSLLGGGIQSIALSGSGGLGNIMTLVANPNPAAQGDPVLLTATVSGNPAPTGTVTFSNGGTVLGTKTLNGNGVATLTTTALPLGTDNLTAWYAGNAKYPASTSNTVMETIMASAGAPTVVSVTPSSGTGAEQTFSAVYSDPNGTADLGTVYLLFNTAINSAHACYVSYHPATNLLYLENDLGAAPLAGIAPGSAGSVSNSQCTLTGAGSSYSAAGNTATLNVALTFASALPTNIYLYAAEANVTASNSGWVKLGTWGASAGASTVVSLTPSSGTGAEQTFSAVYSDPNGTADLGTVYLLFNTAINSAHACYVSYHPATNLLYLENDLGAAPLAGIAPGSAGSVSNSQCTLTGAGSSYSAAGNTATLNVALTFASALPTNIYLYAAEANVTASNSGWVKLGTWGASAGASTVVSLTPSSGTGAEQTFSAVYSDPNGTADLGTVYLLFNTAINSAHACYVSYHPATNLLYLENDLGAAPLAGIAPGSAGSVSNSQCTLTGAGSSYSAAGNTATLNVALTFASALPTNIYLYAAEANVTASNSGWVKLGTWGASAGASTVVSLTPSSGTGAEQTFSAVYSDPNGTADLGTVYLLFNTAINSAHACYVSYHPATNLLYLENDLGAAPLAGIAPGSAGSVSNSQCTLTGAGSSYSAAGNTATLNVALTFASALPTNIYLYAAEANVTASNSGWVKLGTWTP